MRLEFQGPSSGFNKGAAAQRSDLWEPGVIGERPEWHAHAACRGETAVFFGSRGEPTKWVEAKAICAGCPVRVQCLDYALTNIERFGVWGGLSERERRRVRRKRAIARTQEPRRVVEGIEHGLVRSYKTHGCRCPECSEANRKNQRRYDAARRRAS